MKYVLTILSLLYSLIGSAQLTHTEAENYANLSGGAVEACSDAGGGLNVGNMSTIGVYVELYINPISGGSRTFSFRVAAQNTAHISVATETTINAASPTSLGSITVNTGGYQVWTTVTLTATISAGPQYIRLTITDQPCNFNWMEINSYSTVELHETPINSNVQRFAVMLPPDYYTTSTRFPTIIKLHGIGEEGSAATQLFSVMTTDMAQRALLGTFPNPVTVSGTNYEYLMIMPQFATWHAGGADVSEVQAVIDYVKANYRVDTTRIYVVGTSMGGGEAWDYAASSTAVSNRIAAFVTFAGAADSTHTGAINIAAANLPIWSFHNSADPTVGVFNTNDWFTAINSHSPTPLMRKTIFTSSAHDSWTQGSDPTYTESVGGIGTVNVYQWMLNYARGVSAPTVGASASPSTITLPTSSSTLTATPSWASTHSGTVAWTKTSGPSTYTITSPTATSTTVTGLVQGSYVFTVTATQDDSQTATATASVTVNAAVSGGHTIRTFLILKN